MLQRFAVPLAVQTRAGRVFAMEPREAGKRRRVIYHMESGRGIVGSGSA